MHIRVCVCHHEYANVIASCANQLWLEYKLNLNPNPNLNLRIQ